MNELQLSANTVRTQAGAVAVNVSLKDKNKLVHQGVMSLTDFISLLTGTVKKKELPTTVRVGEIPPGFFDGYMSSVTGVMGGIFYVMPGKRQFLLQHVGGKVIPYNVPMPGLIFALHVRDGVKHSFKCLTFKEWKGMDTSLYVYPFGNVHENGGVCMGNINVGKMQCLNDMYKYIHEGFLLGVTNNDYLGGDGVRLTVNATQKEFLDSLKKESEFPNEMLIPAKKYPTVREFSEEFFLYSK